MMDGDPIVIRDQVNEILELVPSVPRLHKLGTLLRGLEYDGDEDTGVDTDMDDDMDDDRPVSASATLRHLRETNRLIRRNVGSLPTRTHNEISKRAKRTRKRHQR
jgi:hypothetical protein